MPAREAAAAMAGEEDNSSETGPVGAVEAAQRAIEQVEEFERLRKEEEQTMAAEEAAKAEVEAAQRAIEQVEEFKRVEKEREQQVIAAENAAQAAEAQKVDAHQQRIKDGAKMRRARRRKIEDEEDEEDDKEKPDNDNTTSGRGEESGRSESASASSSPPSSLPSKPPGGSGEEVEEGAVPSGTASSSGIIPAELLVDAKNLVVHDTMLLGEGGFAMVYQATIDLGTKRGGKHNVAFKRLFEFVKSVGANALAAELIIQSKVDAHPNIVKVLGAVDDPRVGFGLVLELATFGSLYEWLGDKRKEPLWEERIQLLLDVAKGVAALHANIPRIVHSDLKSQNVLLMDAGDGSMIAKLCDFGLAVHVRNTNSLQSSKTGIGTLNWTAPEVRMAPIPNKSPIS